MKLAFLTSSYPKCPGDMTAPFIEEMARALARRGHAVHIVAPLHPDLRRPPEAGLSFHFYRYAPVRSWNIWGYAASLRADVTVRPLVYALAPAVLLSGVRMLRRVCRQERIDLVHAHWVIPNGPIAALGHTTRPLVISLHGSDVFVAERHWLLAAAARWSFRRARGVTACSDDLRLRAEALGMPRELAVTVPYGVDTAFFRPDPAARARVRRELQLDQAMPLVFAAGRFVHKKGFEFLIDAMPAVLERVPAVTLVIAGGGDLEAALLDRARDRGIADRTRLIGPIDRERMRQCLAAADVVAVPSVRDEAGNVDGLPNVVLEALASGTPLVATRVGGIERAARHEETAVLVAEQDATALAGALAGLLADPDRRARLGTAARRSVQTDASWDQVAARLEEVYVRAGAPN